MIEWFKNDWFKNGEWLIQDTFVIGINKVVSINYYSFNCYSIVYIIYAITSKSLGTFYDLYAS